MKTLRKNILCLILVFALSLSLSTVMIFAIHKATLAQEKERISYITQTQASKLQSAIGSLFQKTQTLKMLVIQGNGKVDNFDNIAKELITDSSIGSLQLAPNGVVTQIYPLEGNEEGFGDLFSDPERATEAILARDTNKLTMSGPFELAQGGFGVVGRQPVFLTNEKGESKFWGFTIIVLNLPDALKPADLDRLVKEGYEYKLHRIQPDTKQVQVFAESSSHPIGNTIDVVFDVPNTKWTLSVAPQGGWVNVKSIVVQSIIGLVISFLLTALAYSMIMLNAQRKESQTLSVTDALTGLFNRRMLLSVLSERCEQPNKPFMVCYMDLNDFKNVNDTLGHDFGDHFLIACGERFLSLLSVNDNLYRIGGDEFVAIIENCDNRRDADKIVANISEALNTPMLVDNKSMKCSASIGSALYPCEVKEVDELIRFADESMYEQKAIYKNSQLTSLRSR